MFYFCGYFRDFGFLQKSSNHENFQCTVLDCHRGGNDSLVETINMFTFLPHHRCFHYLRHISDNGSINGVPTLPRPFPHKRVCHYRWSVHRRRNDRRIILSELDGVQEESGAGKTDIVLFI